MGRGVKLHTWALITLTYHKTELDLIPPPIPIPLDESIIQRWPVLHCFLDSPIKIKKHPHLDNYSSRLEWSGTWQQQHGRPRESVVEVVAVRDPDGEKEKRRKREKEREREKVKTSEKPIHRGFLIILSDSREREKERDRVCVRKRERQRALCVYARHISPLATQPGRYRVIELSGKLPLTENGSAIVVAAADAADAIVVA